MNYYDPLLIPFGMLTAAVLSETQFEFIFSITTLAIAIHWYMFDSICHQGDCRYSIIYIGLILGGSWQAHNRHLPKRLVPNSPVHPNEQVERFRKAGNSQVRRTKYLDVWQTRFREAADQHLGQESFELTVEHHQPDEAYFEEEFIQERMREGWTVLVIERPQGATKYRFS